MPHHKLRRAIVFLAGLVTIADAALAESVQVPAAAVSRRYDIAAYVWPSYHPDDRARIFWPMGIGEWETVIKNKPKFPGHQQDRQPLWGYINEADPYVMEMEINAAADHGVNVFIFDWYWYDDRPFLEACLNDGYLKARNNDRVKFYLMWANHDVKLVWDRRNADDAMTGKNQAKIWRGDVDRSQFEHVGRRVIDNYFGHPSYYRIDGKPVFMIYELADLIEGLGSVEQTREALAWLRAETAKAGFPGLHLQACLRGAKAKLETGVDNSTKLPWAEVIRQLGFDSSSHYQFVHMTNVNRDYNAIMEDVTVEWDRVTKEFKTPYFPHLSVGWDNNPRSVERHGSIVTNNTPENFAAALRKARAYADAHPNQPPLITINSWNEWTETSYLHPDTLYGYGYLEAIKRVFLEEPK
jgi:hypothetical protein